MKNNIFTSNIIALQTLINKELTRILRIWPQTILPPIVTAILYFFIFGNLIGKKIGSTCGYNYIQYIIPGLIMMSIITNSYSNVVSSFFGAKFQRNIEELLISPVYNYIIILGFISGGIFRSGIIFVFVFIIASLFSNFYIYNIQILFLSYILTSVIFSLLGLINGIFAKKFDDVNIIPTFILTPIIYLSGIFYSIELLPKTLKFVIVFNPIFYIVNIFRYSIIGISDINILQAYIIMVFFCLIFFLCAYWLLIIGYGLRK